MALSCEGRRGKPAEKITGIYAELVALPVGSCILKAGALSCCRAGKGG